MTEVTDMAEEIPKCPRNFKLWVAFLAGMVSMVTAAVVFDRVSERTRSGSDTPEYQLYGQDIVKTNSIVIVEQQEEAGAWLGIEVQEIDHVIAKELDLNGDSGVLVTKVIEQSPAEAGGIQRGDIIVMFDRRWVKDIQSLKAVLAKTSAGDRVKVDVIRDGRRKVLYVEIGSTTPNNTSGFELLQGQPGGMSQGKGLGITVSPLTPQLAQRFGILRDEQGVVIVEVAPYSIAQRAGLQAGDVINGVNGQGTQDMASFLAAIAAEKAALLDISRQGQDDYVIIDSTAVTPNLPGNFPSSFDVGGILTGGSSEEETDGYKGKPPIIPPMGKPPEPETPQIDATITSYGQVPNLTLPDSLPVAGSTQSPATSAITTVSMLYAQHSEDDEYEKPQCKRLQEYESK